jgi:hypothetical protein
MAQDRLRARLAALRVAAPARRLEAERWARAYYRMHRDLPKGATALIPRRRLFRLIAWAELEHITHLAPLLLRLERLHRYVLDRWQTPNGGPTA